ncbi:unnamed protein product [Gadus morhua 'NCC']
MLLIYPSYIYSRWTLPLVIKHWKGMIFKRLVTANHTHTWWHHITPLSNVCSQNNYMPKLAHLASPQQFKYRLDPGGFDGSSYFPAVEFVLFVLLCCANLCYDVKLQNVGSLWEGPKGQYTTKRFKENNKNIVGKDLLLMQQ